MTDLVVLSLEAWDEVWRRNQHLVAGLLRADPALRVLFVEPAVDPLHDLVTRHAPRRGHGVRAVRLSGAEGRLWSFRPNKLLPRKVDPDADRRLASATVRAARRLGFADPLLWINDPSGAEVLRQTGWPALYDITDDWLEAERTPTEHARLVRDEGFLMERCVEVVVCSPSLAETKGRLRRVTLVPNAVDVEFYRRPQPRPADLPTGPVAVYVGTVHTDRIDPDLCVATARALGDSGTLVLVGPHPLSVENLVLLRSAGVVLLGGKPAAEVPGYLQHADVLVVPHVVTPFTMSLDPIKRYEYAAVGRPVVSTPVTGFMDVEDPRVAVASGDAFAEAVRTVIRAGVPLQTSRPVPSWADRITEMRRVLEQVGTQSEGVTSREPMQWSGTPMQDVVVVLSFYGRDDTLDCVASLREGSPDASVLVIDNGSFDGVLDAVRSRWPEVSLLQTGDNLGYAGGMNTGIRWALARGAQTITVLNNDTRLPPGTIADLAAIAMRGQAVSPEVRYAAEPERIWFGGGTVDRATGLARHQSEEELSVRAVDREGLRPTDILAGCCVTASADTWTRVGLFDERYFLLFEDSEWSGRARRVGVPLVVATRTIIEHRVSASFTGAYDFLGLYYYARNGLDFSSQVSGGSALARARFLRRHVVPILLSDARGSDSRNLFRHGTIITRAVVDHLVGRYGRAPQKLERVTKAWASTA